MGCFEPCLRILRLAPYLVALAFPLASMAQLVAASSAKGARPRFQCAALPDFAARQSTYEQAVQALPRGLFRPRIARRSPSSAPVGVVIAQSTEPLDGNLCWASFVLSDGSLVRVPPLRSLTREVAAQRLQAAGLRMAAREQPSDGAAAGRVVEQRPEADAEVARGSAVQVAIAVATTIGVPDVVGRNLGEARALLARFAVDARQKESVRPAGEVLAQRPPGGTQARPGGEVALTISDGSLVEVPDLVTRPLAQARQLLDQAGLRIATVDDSSGASVGTVTTQLPLARTEVRRDSVVTLHVSAGLSLPGVVGRSLGDAQAALRSFVVQEERVASDRAEGEVLTQSPPAGTRVAARSRVTLSVSDGSIVTVPPLRGATLADARAALQRAGDLQAATPNGDEPGTMLVETSSPSAGIRVRRGSTVSLTLVPLTPWRAWAAAVATLLVLGGAGLYKWRKRKPSPLGPDVHFSPSIEFNVRPIEACAGGPPVPEVGLRAELVVGRPWAYQKEEST